MSKGKHHKGFTGRGRQQGAALYVAMIMLLLLALIGIVGMQVAGLQEKMSSSYMSANMAFQNAEANVRLHECYVEDVVNRTSNCAAGAAAIRDNCADGFDATSWADGQSMQAGSGAVVIRNVGRCIHGNTRLDMGVAPASEDPNPVFQITVYAVNDSDNPTADAAVDTIFRP